MDVSLKALVVTPTIGSPKCLDAIHSVMDQTYPTDHLVIVDGQGHDEQTINSIKNLVDCLELPYNTGNAFGQKFWGHRIFSGIASFVNHDVILFLDDDNWFDPDHVQWQVHNIAKHNLDFSYSLRKVYTKDKQFICADDCESLGKHPVWNSTPGQEHYHLDTSAYAFKREFLVSWGHFWHGGYAQDRKFYNMVRGFANHKGTGQYSLNYRIGSTEASASREFFERGNAAMLHKYQHTGCPWNE
jgi:glycosyltransferase involved in cell wall biosynthesis